MATKNKKQFSVTDKDLIEVAKLLGTKHFILFAVDPEKVHQGLIGSFAGRGVSPKHMLDLSHALRDKAIEFDPSIEVYDLMESLKRTFSSDRPKKKPAKRPAKK